MSHVGDLGKRLRRANGWSAAGRCAGKDQRMYWRGTRRCYKRWHDVGLSAGQAQQHPLPDDTHAWLLLAPLHTQLQRFQGFTCTKMVPRAPRSTMSSTACTHMQQVAHGQT